ncbi:dihydropteroate synthase [Chromatium okenii]|uniref:dihydropteroate synthase n=1 Tax=Chromatium okenii TaxID=61644 RepID=UPI0024135C3F|nr:dihydropteroate synthase [Chromatium okenii]
MSIDTTSAQVAAAALTLALIGSTTPRRVGRSAHVAAGSRLGSADYFNAPSRQPVDMQTNPHYTNVVREVCEQLSVRVDAALAAGIHADNILLIPASVLVNVSKTTGAVGGIA